MERYTVPTRYDEAPYGQICHVHSDNNHYSVYIQTCENQKTQIWLTVGAVFEKAFEYHVDDDGFMDEVMHMFKQNCELDRKDIADFTGDK